MSVLLDDWIIIIEINTEMEPTINIYNASMVMS